MRAVGAPASILASLLRKGDVFPIGIVFVLNEVEHVERLHRPGWEEAVHGVPLVVEELKGNGQLGQMEQSQMRPIDVQQRQPSTGVAQPGESEYQGAQCSAIDTSLRFNLR